MSRYVADPDFKDDIVEIHDEQEELKTEFDSDIILAPAEDALIVVNELNKKELIINALTNALKEELKNQYYCEEDIDYYLKDLMEDLE